MDLELLVHGLHQLAHVGPCVRGAGDLEAKCLGRQVGAGPDGRVAGAAPAHNGLVAGGLEAGVGQLAGGQVVFADPGVMHAGSVMQALGDGGGLARGVGHQLASLGLAALGAGITQVALIHAGRLGRVGGGAVLGGAVLGRATFLLGLGGVGWLGLVLAWAVGSSLEAGGGAVFNEEALVALVAGFRGATGGQGEHQEKGRYGT